MIRKILYKFLVLLLILGGIKALYLVYLYAKNTTQNGNIDLLTSGESIYNCVFVGSSLTYRGIDPKIIDFMCADQNIVSYNLGEPNRIAPETFASVLYLIQNAASIKYIVVELQQLKMPTNTSADLFSPRLQHFVVNYSIGHLRHGHVIPAYNSVKAFLTNTFVCKSALTEKTFKTGKKKEEYAGFRYFHSDNTNSLELLRRERMLMNPPDVIHNKNLFAELIEKPNVKYDEVYLDSCIKLAEMAAEKEVQVYYYLPYGITKRGAVNLMPVLDRIPSKYKLEVHRNSEWTSLFNLDFHWDRIHLNQEGSHLYSRLLGSHLHQKLNSNGVPSEFKTLNPN